MFISGTSNVLTDGAGLPFFRGQVLLNVSKHKPVRETNKALCESCSVRIMGLRKKKFLLTVFGIILPSPSHYLFIRHIFHNAPYLPPKGLHSLCFSFLLGITAVPRETENNAYANFFFWGGGVGIRCIMGNVKEILTVQSWQVRVYTGTKKREYYSLLPITRSLATSKKLLFPFGSFPCNFTLDNSNPVLSA